MTGMGRDHWGHFELRPVFMILVGMTALAIALPAPASAQRERRREVEEITVTAQRREEQLQTAPLSVTAITDAMIEEQNINNVVEVSNFTPNLNIHTNAGGNTGTTVNIRGAITSDPNVNLEPTVGIYVDGVYVGKSPGSLFDMPDLQRIEVLRGPQGTLFGRNTVGGAINIVSKRPADELSATVRMIGGNHETFENQTTLNVPIIGDNGVVQSDALGLLATRATFSFRSRDGFFDNRASGINFPLGPLGELDDFKGPIGSGDFDDLNRFAMRGSVRWQPIDTFTLDYDFDFHRSRERTTAFQLTAVRPQSAGAFLTPFVTINREDHIANNAIFQLDSEELLPLRNTLDVRGHALTAAFDLGEVGPLGSVTLKSITGLRNLDQSEAQDLDGSDVHAAEFGLHVEHESISQEAQVIGTTAPSAIGHFNYVAGFYFFDEEGGENNEQFFFASFPFASRFRSSSNFDNQSYAPYGQASWTPPILDDRINLTGGVRYTREKKEVTRDYRCILAGGVPCGSDEPPPPPEAGQPSFLMTRDKTFDAVSPMVNLSFQATDEVMVYYRTAWGFKSGGFNARAIAPDEFITPFKKEELISFEGGFKADLFENRVRFNAAGFFNDYDNLQVTVFMAEPGGGTVTTIENAARAEIWGAEFELTAIPYEGLNLRAGYGLLLPEYKEFCGELVPGTDECLLDVADERNFVISPEHSITAGIQYTAPPTDHGTLTFGLDVYWQDNVKFAVRDADLNDQQAYALLNGRVQLVDIPLQYGTIDLGVFGRNLFDKKYRNFGIDFGEQLGWAGNTYGDPRTFGFEVIYRWARS